MQITLINNNYNNCNKYSKGVPFKQLIIDNSLKQSPLLDKVLNNSEIKEFVLSHIKERFDVYVSSFIDKGKQTIRLMLCKNGMLTGFYRNVQEKNIKYFNAEVAKRNMSYEPKDIKMIPEPIANPSVDERIEHYNNYLLVK